MRVVIVGGAVLASSSGRNMGKVESRAEWLSGHGQCPCRGINGCARAGSEARVLQERHHSLEKNRRWRNLRSAVAQVHGSVYASGMMLIWVCALIVAADDVIFAHAVGARQRMCGVKCSLTPGTSVRDGKESCCWGTTPSTLTRRTA